MSLEENCDACRGDAVALGKWSDSMGTSHRCWIMRKVIRKEVGAGGRFDFFWTLGLKKNQGKQLGLVPNIITLVP